MNKHLPDFRKIVQPRFDIVFSHEEQGCGERGAFIDGLGQVRDGVQTTCFKFGHCQCRTLITPVPLTPQSSTYCDSLSVASCELWLFDGLLESKGPHVPSVLCQFDVLAGSLGVLFTRVVGLEPIIQRAGQWTSTCALLKYAREETQSPHLRHRKRGGRYRGRQGLTFGPFRGLELLRGSCAQFQGCIAMAAAPDVSELGDTDTLFDTSPRRCIYSPSRTHESLSMGDTPQS